MRVSTAISLSQQPWKECFGPSPVMPFDERQANKILLRLDRKDSEVSPFTKPAPNNARANIAPWDAEAEPAPTEQPSIQSRSIPAINRQSPSASPWPSTNDKAAPMPTSVFGGTFYNDSSENLGQISPGFVPHNGMNFPEGDDRRPSIASATTVSSTGSKSSAGGKFHKKLQGFFGEEYTGLKEPSRQNSETSSVQGNSAQSASLASSRNRNNSLNDATMRSGPPSPSSSRPRTPAAPSSEVTPWVYQDTQVRCARGRHCPADADVCDIGHARDVLSRPEGKPDAQVCNIVIPSSTPSSRPQTQS